LISASLPNLQCSNDPDRFTDARLFQQHLSNRSHGLDSSPATGKIPFMLSEP